MEQKGFITAENANLYLDEKIAKLDEEMGDKMDSLYEKLDEIYNNTTTLLKRAKEDKQVAINLNNRINIIKQKREKAKMQEEKINTFKSDGTLSMLEEVEHRKEESTLNKKKEDEIKKGRKKSMTHLDNIKRIEDLKIRFEEGNIAQKDRNVDDVILLDFMYQLELFDLEDNIKTQSQILEIIKETKRCN